MILNSDCSAPFIHFRGRSLLNNNHSNFHLFHFVILIVNKRNESYERQTMKKHLFDFLMFEKLSYLTAIRKHIKKWTKNWWNTIKKKVHALWTQMTWQYYFFCCFFYCMYIKGYIYCLLIKMDSYFNFIITVIIWDNLLQCNEQFQ